MVRVRWGEGGGLEGSAGWRGGIGGLDSRPGAAGGGDCELGFVMDGLWVDRHGASGGYGSRGAQASGLALSFFLYGIFWRLSSIGTQRHSSREFIALLTAGLGGPTLRNRGSLAAYFRSE